MDGVILSLRKATVSDAAGGPDGAVLSSLRRGLGDAVFDDLLVALAAELARRLVALRAADFNGHGVEDDVRATLSLAATFGFGALAVTARAVLAARGDATGDRSGRLRRHVADLQRLLELVIAVRRDRPVDGALRPPFR